MSLASQFILDPLVKQIGRVRDEARRYTDSRVRFATVHQVTQRGVILVFDGETMPSSKEYSVGLTFPPREEQRVLCVRTSGSWLVVCPVGRAQDAPAGTLDVPNRTITDWDDATSPGWYSAAAGTPNAPEASGRFDVLVTPGREDGQYFQQLAFLMSSGAPYVYHRYNSAGVWQEWLPLSPQVPPTVHELGTAGEPTLKNSWSDSSFRSTYGRCRFYQATSGRVFIEGVIGDGSSNGDTIFTLPAGFRPATKLIFTCIGSITTPWRVDVKTNGDVISVAGNPTSNAFLSLTGISFRTDV